MLSFGDIINYLKPGGIIMIPLLLLSFFMWISIIEKYSLFRRFNGKEKELVASFVKNFVDEKTGDKKSDSAILRRNLISVKNIIHENLGTISVLCAVAPLFGLLGTVTGMMNTFDVINIYGSGNSGAMASGIKEALITTQGGLFIAIPGVLCLAHLKSKAFDFENRINIAASNLKRIHICQEIL